MSGASSSADAVSRELLIVNQRGLHARASAKFVQLAAGFQAAIEVEREGVAVGGTSIMGLMMLAAGLGSTIRVTARGEQAEQAVEALAQLVASRFGEEC
ncbi:HPr family phosphocarrier protein [Pseudaminobacter sp. 19-2017]|uniref:HPr family phosphocarrier protein n=1 Tax=Pseudaminobacter soli (ex Zhang et al. 2022) TaxID=2831468 RepID=A0A942I7T2_9HYPH|nr:HPr family phosphocarrier protein [Pseudaminobacter soli]MBS3648695.1 HPr family phosphocarrier protein [Pseudaminobacter soli]